MKKNMNKTMKRFMAFFLVCVLVFSPNVGKIFAADTTATVPNDAIWTVTDVGDQALYNFLVAMYPSNDGHLYRADTAKLTYLNSYSGNYLSFVDSYSNLHKICPKITEFSVNNFKSQVAFDTYLNVLGEYVTDGQSLVHRIELPTTSSGNYIINDNNVTALEKLTNLDSIAINTSLISETKINELLAAISNKMTSCQIYGDNSSKNIDLSNLKTMVNETNNSTGALYIYSNLSTGTFENLKKLHGLTSLTISGLSGDCTFDLSSFVKLNTISLTGTGITAVPDFSNLLAMNVSIGNNSLNSKDRTYLTGLKLNKNVAYGSLSFIGVDLSTQDNVGMESQYNLKLIQNLNISNCKLSGNTIDFSQIGTQTGQSGGYYLSGLGWTSIYNSGLTSVKGLDTPHNNASRLELLGNSLTEIGDITDSNWRNLSTLNLSDNDISKIGELPSLIMSLFLDNNAISDPNSISSISATIGEGDAKTSKYKNMSLLNLSRNQLTTLPDISKISSLEKNYGLGESYLNHLVVYGNNFTSALESFKGKVSDTFYSDPNWLNKAMAKVTSSGILYYEKVTDSLISSLYSGGNSIYLYTDDQNISIGQEIMGWLKLKGINLTIYYIDINSRSILKTISINGNQLASTEEFSYSFVSEESTYKAQIVSAFKGGDVLATYTSVDKDPNRAGVTISDNSNSNPFASKMQSGKYYNLYQFNTENNSYVYSSTISNISYNSCTGTYFIVDVDADQNIGFYLNGFGAKIGYYKTTDNAEISRIIDSSIKNNISSITVSAKEFTISAETMQKLIDSKSSLTINYFDGNNASQNACISYYSAKVLDTKISFSTIGESNVINADLVKAFTYGTPEKYYTVVKGNSSNWVTVNYSSSYSLPDTTNYSVYAYDEESKDFALVSTNIADYNKVAFMLNTSGSYFVVPVNSDTYVKKNVSSYNFAELSDAVISRQIKLASKYPNVALTFSADKDIILSEATLTALKTSAKSISVYYYGGSSGSIWLGSTMVNGTTLDSVAGGLTLKGPEIVKSDAIAKLDIAFAPFGKAAGYFTVNDSHNKGVSTSVAPSLISNGNISTNEKVNLFKYDSVANKFVKSVQNIYVLSHYELSAGTYAVAYVADYVTPSDAQQETQPPTVEPTQPVTEAPTQPATVAPTQPATVAPTQPTTVAPTQPTTVAPTQPTTVAQTQPTTVAQTQPTTEVSTQPSGSLEVTTAQGVNSAPAVVQNAVISNELVESSVISSMKSTVLPEVEVISQGAPVVNSNLFQSMKENHKDVTLGVVNTSNQLQYSWTFNYDTLKNTGVTIDLSVKFDTDKKTEIEKITGTNAAMYLEFAYHGQLPGPATMKTYVGDQYKNGDIVYLYYYNEESGKVEAIGGGGLNVQAGYVEYTITHCSVYFLSTTAPDVLGVGFESAVGSSQLNASVATGDMSNHQSVLAILFGGSICLIGYGTLYFRRRKKLQR